MKHLPEIDILPHRVYAMHLKRGKDHQHSGVISDTAEAGSYNIHVRVTGHSSHSKTPFQRSKLVSVLVK
jgi:acetylornithine deacetylase/succinyl-diaminopimelate desuccinylase-like protein